MRKFICILFMLLLIILSFCGCSTSLHTDYITKNNIVATNNIATDSTVATDEINSEITTEQQFSIDSFVDKFNTIASNKISITGTFDTQDKTSGHYQTEYRLNAYKDSTAKTGTIANQIIDIIDYSSNTVGKKNNIRIHAYANNNENMLNILKTSINIFDNSITDNEIQATINDVYEYSSKSFYYGNYITGCIIGQKDGTYEITINYSKSI